MLVTEWNQFRSLDLARLKSIMHEPLLVDLRNIYRSREIEGFGFRYESIGRAHSNADFAAVEAAE